MRFLKLTGVLLVLILCFVFRAEALNPAVALIQSDSLSATADDSVVTFSSGYEAFLLIAMDADLLVKVVSQSDITEPDHWIRLDQDATLRVNGAKVKKLWWRTAGGAAAGVLQWIGIR